ncbi:MAG: phospholipase, partial [Pseudomonadales bacterium]|nr:phospholipase [Pseudomonadales bacterium]
GLLAMLYYGKSRWTGDDDHILLTGMSDGATYSLLAALHADSPFTHVAPFSGVLHPELATTGRLRYASGRPIYLVHGKLDWMFPIETAWMARQELENAGADLVFREIDDLSHNYARALNPDVLDWFNPALGIPGN